MASLFGVYEIAVYYLSKELDLFSQLKFSCIKCLPVVGNFKPNAHRYLQMLRPQGSCQQPVPWHPLRKDPFSLFCLVHPGHISALHVAGDLIMWQKVPGLWRELCIYILCC